MKALKRNNQQSNCSHPADRCPVSPQETEAPQANPLQFSCSVEYQTVLWNITLAVWVNCPVSFLASPASSDLLLAT